MEDNNIVFLVADEDKQIAILHSPKNFGGIRTCPMSKVAAMIGLRPTEIRILLNKKMTLKDFNLVTPTIEEFELSNTGSKDAKIFNEAHKVKTDLDGSALNHAEAFSLWAYGVGKGLMKEIRFGEKPDNEELHLHCKNRQKERIFLPTSSDRIFFSNSVGDNASALAQLTTAMSRQSEYAERANNLRHKELDRKKDKEDKKKDRLGGFTQDSIKHADNGVGVRL
eukprot:15366175-Ditylum_brightwellii.AAC.1